MADRLSEMCLFFLSRIQYKAFGCQDLFCLLLTWLIIRFWCNKLLVIPGNGKISEENMEKLISGRL